MGRYQTQDERYLRNRGFDLDTCLDQQYVAQAYVPYLQTQLVQT